MNIINLGTLSRFGMVLFSVCLVSSKVLSQNTIEDNAITAYNLKLGSHLSENKFTLKKPLNFSKPNSSGIVATSCEDFILNADKLDLVTSYSRIGDKKIGYNRLILEQKEKFKKNTLKINFSQKTNISGGLYEIGAFGKKTTACIYYFDEKLFGFYTFRDVTKIKEITDAKFGSFRQAGSFMGGNTSYSYNLPNGILAYYRDDAMFSMKSMFYLDRAVYVKFITEASDVFQLEVDRSMETTSAF